MKTILLLINLFLTNILFCQSAENVYEKVKDCIVMIYTYDSDDNYYGKGSGVIVSNEGLIFTNYHLFQNGKFIIHFKEEKIAEYTILGADPQKDILIIKAARIFHSHINI